MAWTTPRTWVTAEVVTAAQLNTHVRDNLNFLRAMHGVQATNSGTQSIANTTDVALTWDTETFDTDALHDTATNPTRITIPAALAGYWRLFAKVHWAGNATGNRRLFFRKGGATLLGGGVAWATNASVFSPPPVSLIVNLSGGDYVEAMVHQTSGGALATALEATVGMASWFEAEYLGN